MKQVIKKLIADAHDIKQEELIYTLIIDGNNLLKLSSVDKRLNDKNEEYGIVFQFLLQLRNLLLKKDYNFCYVMWDGYKSGQLRYNYYPEYKIQRGKQYDDNNSEYYRQMNEFCRRVIEYSKKKRQEKELKRSETDEENFERQRNIIFQCLEELFVRQVICDEVEGDDLIAYYVNNKKPNERIVIVSGDRDLTQLISDEVCLYIPSLKKYITPQNHITELGYTHENVLLKKILCGDDSDYIKGIKGMGEKTFFSLFPDAKTKKLTLDDIFTQSKKINEERAAKKLKPLSVLNNVLNKVTNGCQGSQIYEINEKIINLKKPLLTKAAQQELDDISYAPLEIENRTFTNLYQIIQDNHINDLIDSEKFGNFFSAFNKLIDNEKKFFQKKD